MNYTLTKSPLKLVSLTNMRCYINNEINIVYLMKNNIVFLTSFASVSLISN